MSKPDLPPHYDEPKLQAFIAVWKRSTSEDSTGQSFFRELCQVLGVPEPRKGEPDETYRFEKRVPVPEGTKLTKKRADVYRQDLFVWENKSFLRTKAGDRPSRWIDWMREAYEQAKRYGKFLADQSPKSTRPPVLVVCDIGRDIWMWNTFATGDYGSFEDRHEIIFEDLLRPKVFQALQWALSDPHRLNPYRESGLVTLAIAKSLGNLADRLEKRLGTAVAGEINESIARFMMACIFTMFAEDMKFLDKKVFTDDLCHRWQAHPEYFVSEVTELWKLMNKGGTDRQLGQVPEFNGGLFRECPVLPLEVEEIRELAAAAKRDWTEVEPSIFGTLLEQSLRTHERSRLGAHFTPREYIERIVRPTIIEPLRAEWQVANAEAVRLSTEAKEAKEKGQVKESRALLKEARQQCYAFLERLRNVRILDPACGTGNFLYVALDLLKRLEKEILVALRDLGETHEQMTAVLVQPDQFFGIERKPWSKEITELVLWIGYLQWWRRERGQARPPEPVLRQYGNIECRDAVMSYDKEEDVLDATGKPVIVTRQGKKKKKGTSSSAAVLKRYLGTKPSEWPDVDFIVSNPPFIGNKPMRERLGDGYVEAIRKIYAKPTKRQYDSDSGLSCDVDYVAYWWHKAALRLRDPKSRLRRFGFITTNSIKQWQSGSVLRQHIGNEIILHFACPDHPWVDPSEELGSAAVRISMTVARRATEPGARPPLFAEDLDSKRDPRAAARKLAATVRRGFALEDDGALAVQFAETNGVPINPDLTVGANVTEAKPLHANSDICFQGMNLVGDGFRLSPEEAFHLIGDLASRPPTLRPYILGHDLKEAPAERYVIDFYDLDEAQAQKAAPALFNHLVSTVKPLREKNRRGSRREKWWIFGEPVGRLRNAMGGLTCYIATVETSKHRFFVMLDSDIVPDHKLYAIASDDYYVLGVLSSRVHMEWALRAGGSNGIGNDPTWTNTTTFLRFPFPTTTEVQRAVIENIAHRLEATRRSVLRAHPGVSLTDLYNTVSSLRVLNTPSGANLSLSAEEQANAKAWHCHTLLLLHDELDQAVLTAYGFPSDISKDDLLRRLVDLNLERASEEAKGTIRWLRPGYQEPLWKQRTGAGQTKLPEASGEAQPDGQLPVWPIGGDRDSIRAQVAVIRDVVTRAGRALTIEEIAAGIAKPPRTRIAPAILRHLQALEVVGAFVSSHDPRGEVWSLDD